MHIFLSPFKPSHTEPLISSIFQWNKHIEILRDDLIHPIVSGNKWRKLKHLLEQMQKTQKDTLVTFGGAYSNHLVATAFAGNFFNINTHAFVRGNEIRPINQYEQSCIDNGMTLQHVSRSEYKDKENLFNKYLTSHPDAIFLDEGGDHPLAIKGCAEILNELEHSYDYIVLALGTGTTMEGLVKGAAERQLDTQIIGISTLKNNFSLDRRLQNYPEKYWRVFHDYHRGKYAKMDEELLKFILDFYTETKIKLDPVYTGKMLMAVADLYKKDFFRPKDRILLIHTGGLMAFPKI